MEHENELILIADRCIQESFQARPEQAWMQSVCERYMQRHDIPTRADLDEILYEKIYQRSGDRYGVLKIRYWRTGRHVPVGRAECGMLARALELSPDESDYLMQAYFDRSDRVLPRGASDPVYLERLALIRELTEEYLSMVHPDRLLQTGVRSSDKPKNLRHLFYTDCRSYVCVPHGAAASHLASASFEAEFKRTIQLTGEISRTAMLRNLIVLGNPFLTGELLSKRLQMLGYHPLDEGHTTVKGFRLDLLVSELMRLYRKTCEGKDPEICREWLQGACRCLDQRFKEKGQDGMRFMLFKALTAKGKLT